MREIKFRVWNPHSKVMDYSANEINVNGTNIVAEVKDGKVVAEYMPAGGIWKSAEIMQYTGLKDRNGKEIYDGDVVVGEHATYSISWDGGKGQYKAKIVTTRSVLTKNLSFPLWQYVEDDGKCRFEVIGNIRQNPELLTE